MPMSGLMFVIRVMTRVVMIPMVMIRMVNLRIRMDAILAVRIGIRNFGQMKVGKVVAVVMVMKNRAAFGRPAGVKEDHCPAARSGKNRLPVSDQSARSVHHPTIRLGSNIGFTLTRN